VARILINGRLQAAVCPQPPAMPAVGNKDYALFRKMIKKINGEDWEPNLHVDGSKGRT